MFITILFFFLPICLGYLSGSQAPAMQVDSSLSVQLSHALITCSLSSCWQGVGGERKLRGLSLEQVGNKTVPVVLKTEDIRVEFPHLFVTIY